jgi:acetate---CoA ligase (ADP-forming)
MNVASRLDALFAFSSIAVIGASPRNHLSLSVLEGLRTIGFTGQAVCINPKADPVLEFPAYSSLADVPFPVEHAVIVVRADRVPGVMEECAAAGVRGATIQSAGFAEAGEEGRALQEALVRIAEGSGIAVCGPNCMGLLSVHDRTSTYARAELPRVAGNVGIISHSGGVLNEILAYGIYRGIGFSKAVSAGNEAVCGVADYLEHLVDDPSTTAIGLVVEGIRSPGRIRAAFAGALERRKPVVAIKIGSSKLAARAAATHTGAIVGSSNIFAALCAQYGVTLVDDVDELCESLLGFSKAAALLRGDAPPRSVAVIEISGGGGELVCDIAERAGLQIAPPLDLVTPWESPESFGKHEETLESLAASGDFDAVVSRLSVTQGEIPAILRHGTIIETAAHAHPEMLFAVLSRASDSINLRWRDFIAASGITYFQGYKRGLGAIARLMAYKRKIASPPGAVPEVKRPSLGEPGLLDEVASKDLLAQLGMPVNRTIFASSVEEAVAAAESVRFPVVVKGIASGASHKSEYGLVALDLKNADEVASAAKRMLAVVQTLRFSGRAGLSVQSFVPAGLEAIVGAYRDELYGPVIVCALGGFFAEAFDDRVLRLAPVDAESVGQALEETKLGKLARGFRGLPAVDVAPLAKIVALLSAWIAGEDRVAEVDLNPVILSAGGPSIVDARIVIQAT